jgi:hypothetical protein
MMIRHNIMSYPPGIRKDGTKFQEIPADQVEQKGDECRLKTGNANQPARLSLPDKWGIM